MKTLYEIADSYGEDKDKFLGYVIGATSSLYSSMKAMIANVETIKFMTMLSSLEQGAMIYQKMLRESHKSEATKPV